MFLPPIPIALGIAGVAGLGYWWWHQHQAAQQGQPPTQPSQPGSSGGGGSGSTAPMDVNAAAEVAVNALVADPNYCANVAVSGSAVNNAVHNFKVAWNASGSGAQLPYDGTYSSDCYNALSQIMSGVAVPASCDAAGAATAASQGAYSGGDSGGSSSGGADPSSSSTPWWDPTGWFTSAYNWGASATGNPSWDQSQQTATSGVPGYHPELEMAGALSSQALATKAALAAMGYV